MVSGIIIGIFWIVILIFALCCLIVTAIRYVIRAREYHNEAKELVKKVEKRTQMNYNKIVSLTPAELHTYLSNIFLQTLELASDGAVVENDPEAVERIYTIASANLIKYIGPETYDAIDYYYGKHYLIRWARQVFDILESRGVIEKIIRKEMNADAAVSRLNR